MQLTDARRRGLAVLADADRDGATARESNITSDKHRTVYWQTVTWLLQHGLARKGEAAYGAELAITAKGRTVAASIAAGGAA